MRRSRKSSGQLDISLAPFVDVVFLLLCFFVVTSKFDDLQKLAIVIPETESSFLAKGSNIIEVSIDKNSKIVIAGSAIDINNYQQIETALSNFSTSVKIIIKADKLTPHGTVIQLIDIASKIGFQEVSMATIQKK